MLDNIAQNCLQLVLEFCHPSDPISLHLIKRHRLAVISYTVHPKWMVIAAQLNDHHYFDAPATIIRWYAMDAGVYKLLEAACNQDNVHMLDVLLRKCVVLVTEQLPYSVAINAPKCRKLLQDAGYIFDSMCSTDVLANRTCLLQAMEMCANNDHDAYHVLWCVVQNSTLYKAYKATDELIQLLNVTIPHAVSFGVLVQLDLDDEWKTLYLGWTRAEMKQAVQRLCTFHGPYSEFAKNVYSASGLSLRDFDLDFNTACPAWVYRLGLTRQYKSIKMEHKARETALQSQQEDVVFLPELDV